MFKLNLLTPEKRITVDQEITEITVPTYAGDRNILPGHVPMITTLGTGVIKFKNKLNNLEVKAVISSGFCEVTPEGVNVLAEFIQTKEEMDEKDSVEKIKLQNLKLSTESLTDEQYLQAIIEVDKAQAALRVIS